MGRLLVLPDFTASAVENMATDLTLLQRWGARDEVLFRHYSWSEPAFTFGVSQPLAFARKVAISGVAVVRRPTGGGVVDHRTDWTYALVAPSSHPLAEMKATDSYRLAHVFLAEALADAGVPVALVPCSESGCTSGRAAFPGACFAEPTTHDVVCGSTGRKVAGAAQKRTRDGILFQGYVERSLCPGVDWIRFRETFSTSLARGLGVRIESTRRLPVSSADIEPARKLFSSADWNARR